MKKIVKTKQVTTTLTVRITREQADFIKKENLNLSAMVRALLEEVKKEK